MRDEPEDEFGECNARLYITANSGDDHATMRCHLQEDHAGEHEFSYKSASSGRVTVIWEKDQQGLVDDYEDEDGPAELNFDDDDTAW